MGSPSLRRGGGSPPQPGALNEFGLEDGPTKEIFHVLDGGIVQGRPAYYFTTGTYAGPWLPMARGIGVA